MTRKCIVNIKKEVSGEEAEAEEEKKSKSMIITHVL